MIEGEISGGCRHERPRRRDRLVLARLTGTNIGLLYDILDFAGRYDAGDQTHQRAAESHEYATEILLIRHIIPPVTPVESLRQCRTGGTVPGPWWR